MSAEKTPRKQRGRPFSKGSSGNPSGRPKGARNRSTVLAEKLMQDDAQEVTRAVVTAAKNGDMTAARLVLDRIVPPRKGRPVKFALPSGGSAGDLAAAVGAVVTAMARGELTPDEASTVASVLEVRRRAIETAELEKRIERLEKSADTRAST